VRRKTQKAPGHLSRPTALLATAAHRTRNRTEVRKRPVAGVGPLADFCCLRGVDCCGVYAGKAASGRARPLSRRRSARRADYPALLGPAARGKTRCASCARCAQTAAASQFTKRAGARGHEPCAARRRPFAPVPTRPQPCGQSCAAFEAHAGHRRLQADASSPARGRQEGRSDRDPPHPRTSCTESTRSVTPTSPDS
jgi:hypothetical protein